MSVPETVKGQLRARLEELADEGLDGLPRRERVRPSSRSARVAAESARTAEQGGTAPTTPVSVEPIAAPAAEPVSEPVSEPVAELPAVEPASLAGDDAWQALELTDLGAALADCRRCKLSEKRTQVVFGVGNPEALLMFVGEGPGRDEDLKGEPFVGKAGRLLTDMIEKGMRLKRADVYIANVVKCRPPNNRDPEPDEVASCEPFLARQVELVQPEVIVALGRFAVQCLLQTTRPISRLRGEWHEYRGIDLMPTFHPAYLLRNESEKRAVWNDLQAVMRKLGLPLPGS